MLTAVVRMVKRTTTRGIISGRRRHCLASQSQSATVRNIIMSGVNGAPISKSCTNITILHFNDCYNIEPNANEPLGGAARFKTALNSFFTSSSSSNQEPLVLFSGDIMAPSVITTFTNGQHMIPVLNQCNVACACFGNHEFEFGVDHLISFTKQTSFPWVMSNINDVRTGRPLAQGKPFHVISRNGKKIGLIGLVESEWISTLPSCCDLQDFDYHDFVEEGEKYAKYLKSEEKVDLVIALTHMRWPNDRRLAHNTSNIDLILGGHDHDYGVEQVNGKYIIKSGCDFMSFSKINVSYHENGIKNPPQIEVSKVEVTSRFREDIELKQELQKYTQVMESQMDNELAQFASDLDCRFSVIRTSETKWGNLIADIMRRVTSADLCIINSGSFRSDRIHSSSVTFKYRDFVTLMPKVAPFVVLIASGSQIHEALENGVSQFPKLEGRFPQVSGVSFLFDPDRDPGDRIKWQDIKINGQQIDLNQEYKLVTKAFLAEGRDGYTVLKGCKIYMNDEEVPPLFASIFQFFDFMKGRVIDARIEGRITNLQLLKNQK